ncbi:nucleoside triphosphate pyrophosphatase [Alteromonas sp. ASW11-36]|uniref:7-methyl-GTP pyrophosphatase n=1 Tax=Alteromonas arenosi TaxID=3055817 RepID=A0ABT7SX06_9ALTE|nr:nucleoside triphosphate pyrophosphatase [Alteromonas sp. ASW11-36]MDM7860723.1 nucleoside triphosphate pyrophosphatase [Alteromonas sp. ASW11-36]
MDSSPHNSSDAKLILASTSRYRRAQLETLNIPFDCVAPNIDESATENELSTALAERLSIQKAKAISILHPEALVIGSDQVAELRNPDGSTSQFGKSLSVERAIGQLKRFSGNTVTFYTGLAIIRQSTNHLFSAVDTVTVKFRRLTDEQITRYVAIEMPLDCAGSFKCEGLGIRLFESIESSDPNSLIGLPLIKTIEGLLSFGYDPLFHQNQ